MTFYDHYSRQEAVVRVGGSGDHDRTRERNELRETMQNQAILPEQIAAARQFGDRSRSA
jgi:hypothetical protein